ncbi:hypothetical protein [Priestia megaterium]|uniref:hypothetical protein n=1 Tax=Priestia megaterium TaxID=1404 RepID=UPI00101D7E55|nr:hypothetical protein [Priestia megaterium]
MNIYSIRKVTAELALSNVLKFWLQDGSWFAIRLSSTESKVKFYFGVKQGTEDESEERLEEVETSVLTMVDSIVH